jgi:hypothetical protein
MLAVYARFSTTKTRLLAPVMQLLDYLLASALHMAFPYTQFVRSNFSAISYRPKTFIHESASNILKG